MVHDDVAGDRGTQVNGAVVASWKVDGMITGCDVPRRAGESIPDDFEAAGECAQTVAAVRQRYTNYDALLEGFPDCPEACPIAAINGDLAGAACPNYRFVQHALKTDARRLAKSAYDAWHAQRHEAPAAHAF